MQPFCGKMMVRYSLMKQNITTPGQHFGLVVGVPQAVLALIIGAPIAVLVVFFWLRELDLSFLATYRALVLPLVVVAGILLGHAFGKLSGHRVVNLDEATRKKLEQMSWFPQPFGAWLLLVVGIGIMLLSVPSALLQYWQLAGHTPLLIPPLTQSLLVVLWWTLIATELITHNLVLLRALHTQRQQAQLAAQD
jgi:hypothetical protein